MAGELELVLHGERTHNHRISIAEAIARILPRGHSIHGYSSGDDVRIIKILESRKYSDDAPLLGYGEDGSAERALARALITYALREQQGTGYLSEAQFPESTQGQFIFGRNVSRFDNIVWGGDFKLYQDGIEIVAASRYGGGHGMSPLEVRAANPVAAVVGLANEYDFMNDAIKLLPPVSLD